MTDVGWKVFWGFQSKIKPLNAELNLIW